MTHPEGARLLGVFAELQGASLVASLAPSFLQLPIIPVGPQVPPQPGQASSTSSQHRYLYFPKIPFLPDSLLNTTE